MLMIGVEMFAPPTRPVDESIPGRAAGPRFHGLLWRLARLTTPVLVRLAGHRWNPIFAVVLHRGRRTGRRYAAPVAARRIDRGFVISLSFGTQVDWYRNLMAAGDGVIRWRGGSYRVGAPEPIDGATALSAFNPVQRAALRLTGIEDFIRVGDMEAVEE